MREEPSRSDKAKHTRSSAERQAQKEGRYAEFLVMKRNPSRRRELRHGGSGCTRLLSPHARSRLTNCRDTDTRDCQTDTAVGVCCQYACAHADCLSDAFAHCCTISR